MPNHAEELGRFLLEQRGSLTTDVCKKAIEEAAAKIEKDKALRGIEGVIADLRTFLMRRQGDPEACLAELRRVLLKSAEIMKAPTNGKK